MKKLTDYLSQEKIDELAAKGITFERYVERTYKHNWDAKPVTSTLIKEEVYPNAWTIKKPKVKSRKELQAQGLGDIYISDIYDEYEYRNDPYSVKWCCDILISVDGFHDCLRYADHDFTATVHERTIQQCLDYYNGEIVFAPENTWG